jgi:bifunctional non-homologous end joining protein LigD
MGTVCRSSRSFAGATMKLRWRHHDERVFVWAFDLLELDGRDLRREPIEVRKASWRVCCDRAALACSSTSTWSTPATSSFVMRARWASKTSSRSGWGRVTSTGRSRDWLKFKNPNAPAVKREFEEDWGNTRRR